VSAPAGVDRSPLEAGFYREHWGDMPPPKFSTPRDFTAPTLGSRQAAFAKVWLGQPFMPFQRYVADVAGELRLNDAGLWVPRYRTVVYVAQRQVGKSHQSMARKGERCFSNSGWKSWYTAQTGQDARDQFLKFYDDNIVAKHAPLENVVQLKRGRGEELLVFPNGSFIRPHPPTEAKLHGKQSDDNDVDEAWAFTKEEGEALVQAGAPTKLTRPHSQTWIMSAGGTAESTWLAELVANGRLGAAPTVCFIEFGIPEGADAEDLQLIAAYHPAYGHTVTMDALIGMRADFGSDAAGWARAGGNVWTEAIGGAIPTKLWQHLGWSDTIPDDAPIALGAARAADGTQVAIAAAARLEDTIVVEILDVFAPARDSADRLKTWAASDTLAIARNGPSAGLASKLEALGTKSLHRLASQEEAAAVANFLDALDVETYKRDPTTARPTIRFRPHPDLDAAAKVAGVRSVGDGGQAWARVSATAPIATLEAASNAVWALDHQPRSPGKPRLITTHR